MKTRRPWNYPPGPPSVPFIGNLNLDLKNLLGTLRQCRKKYGDIFSLILGTETVVVICSRDKITEVLVKNGDIASDRPRSFFYSELLTPYGYDRLPYEKNILKEVTVLQEKLKEKQGLPFDVTELLHVSVSNVICCFSFGKRYNHENKDLQTLTKVVADISSNPDVVGLLTFLPFLKYLPFDLVGAKKVKRAFNLLRYLCKQETIRHKNTYQRDNIRDILDYLINLQLEGDMQDFQITDEMITEVIIELFAAGTETSSTSLRWFLLFIIKHPAIQERMHQEIMENVEANVPVTLQDRHKLPYCQAVILETLRLGTVAPFSLPHMATDDIDLEDCMIPKGAYILPSLDSINNNEEDFHNPDEFHSERFLDLEGQITNHKTILPFSLG
ncbi:hypothetical protein FSP39_000062 [Pinctada imbricata]|uniref:Uncharacterized protein n=1 Tax=Pinctada imbricata TaxID=66713 RepID=A0AA88YIG3_PINIB|nr:hypothetical protein FSP39_000062 [Pinctada imbricata]